MLMFLWSGGSLADNIRSIETSIMIGWQLQCAYTTCLPFSTVTTLNERACQINCLAEMHCQAASFRQANSQCQLFTSIQDQNDNLLADVDTVTMIVMSGTRVPPG